jgi:hypothetical protein
MNIVTTRVVLAMLLVLGSATTEVASQTVPLKQLMRQKLVQSEKLLEAVVTSNWAELARRSRTLEELTNEPAWMALKTPEYVRQSSAFMEAAHDLADAADRRDQEATPVAYLSLTLSCVRCHQYVARARIARTAGSGAPATSDRARLSDTNAPKSIFLADSGERVSVTFVPALARGHSAVCLVAGMPRCAPLTDH